MFLIWENMCCQVEKTDCKAMKHEWYILVTPADEKHHVHTDRRYAIATNCCSASPPHQRRRMHAMPSQQMEQLQAATIHKVRAELRAHALLLKCVNLCPGKCACVPSEKPKNLPVFSRSHVYAGGWCCCCRCCCCRCCFALLQPNEKLFGGFFQSKCVTHVGRSSQCYGPISCPG